MEENQSKNYIQLFFLVMAAVILGAAFLYNTLNNQTQNQDAENKNIQTSVKNNKELERNIVIYTDSGYSPAALTIKKGESVMFLNESSVGMWTASDPHPVHTAYPESGGCINSSFDSCVRIEPGKSWSFTFNQTGTWGYHNHAKATHKGVVIVTE